MLFWHIFTKSNTILTFVLYILNPSLMGNINYSSLKKCCFHKIYENYVYYFHNQLTIKPMNITHGKTTHLVGLTKPKQAYLQSPTGSGQPTHKSQQLENTWTGQPNFSNNWTAGAPSHQVPTCLIRSENRHVSTRGWILFPQAEIPSFLMWHKAEMDVTESWKASTSCHFFLLHPFSQEPGAAMPRPLKLLKPLEISLFSY